MISTDFKEIKPNNDCAYHGYTIYSLVNLDNGKRYIGRTRDLGSRLRSHFYALKSHTHPNPLLNKDSDCRFGFEVLEENISPEKRKEKENYYIKLYRTFCEEKGYNVNDPMFKDKEIEIRDVVVPEEVIKMMLKEVESLRLFLGVMLLNEEERAELLKKIEDGKGEVKCQRFI